MGVALTPVLRSCWCFTSRRSPVRAGHRPSSQARFSEMQRTTTAASGAKQKRVAKRPSAPSYARNPHWHGENSEARSPVGVRLSAFRAPARTDVGSLEQGLSAAPVDPLRAGRRRLARPRRPLGQLRPSDSDAAHQGEAPARGDSGRSFMRFIKPGPSAWAPEPIHHHASRRRSALAVTALVLGVLSGAGAAHAAPGDLDMTFSGDGKLTVDFGGPERGEAVALRPNPSTPNSIAVAGHRTPTIKGRASTSPLPSSAPLARSPRMRTTSRATATRAPSASRCSRTTRGS